MIFKQFQDEKSKTFTYILAEGEGEEALIIDSVEDNIQEYLAYLGLHKLRLKVAMDTHIHADHITGLDSLRKLTRCMTVMSKHSDVKMVARGVDDGNSIDVGQLKVKVLSTPGHTNDSVCYMIDGMIFTGDTLFIRGNGRTDFQNGSSSQLYDSVQDKLFSLPDSTVVWPGHDYKGENMTTIGTEKIMNPRFSGKSKEDFIKIMENLDLPNPKLMDIAVPKNKDVGNSVEDSFSDHQIFQPDEAQAYIGQALFVDLRSDEEIKETGMIKYAIQVEFFHLHETLNDPKHLLTAKLKENEAVIFYCAHGERSALALEITAEENLGRGVGHISGGIARWEAGGLPLVRG